MKELSAAILAGGKNRRMGTHKAWLQLGGETFLTRIRKQLDGCAELLLSVDNAHNFAHCGLPLVTDLYADCGPIGGIYSALSCCRTPYLLVVSCDLPLFTRGLAEYLYSYVTAGYDAFAAVTRDGRVQPLCCIYAKSALPVLKQRLLRGDLRLLDALSGLSTKEVLLAHSAYADETLYNVNNHAQYMELCRRLQGPPLVAVSGVKNSGKTTLLRGLIPCLQEAGLRVAVLKHDGHDFEPDVPGTDSYALRQTEADLVGVYSASRYLLTERRADCGIDDLLRHCQDLDLVILEGGKYTDYPKIEIVRGAVSQAPVGDPRTLLALATDTELRLPGVPSHGLDDYAGLARLLLQYMRGQYAPDTSAWERKPALYGFPVPPAANEHQEGGRREHG